jgi:hypothetical protein
MKVDFVNSALDLIEGTVIGGVLGFGAYVIGGAVSVLGGSFLAAADVTPLAVVVGALGFVGYSIQNIRSRINSNVTDNANVKQNA